MFFTQIKHKHNKKMSFLALAATADKIDLEEVYPHIFSLFDALAVGNHHAVRQFLKKKSTDITERKGKFTPLMCACLNHDDDPGIIELILAYRPNIDINEEAIIGNQRVVKAKDIALDYGNDEIVSLLDTFEHDPINTAKILRKKVGYYNQDPVEVFVLVVMICDEHFTIKESENRAAAQFFRLAVRLPMELQKILCNRVYGETSDVILAKKVRDTMHTVMMR